jgi:hypothetical protein
MSKSYEALYAQVVREIEKRLGIEATKTSSRFSVQPGGAGGSIDSRAIAEMMSTLTDDLGEIIEPRIILGLDVSATTPPSSNIEITSGIATSHGKKWTLSADTSIKIPLDSSTYVFFVTIYNDTLEVSRTFDSTKCELCRIIVPKPGITIAIVDDMPKDGYDAYIVSAQDIVYKESQEFDDASIEKLRDVIGDILADNLIGNIKLSENLKIINTQGTLELDSSSVKIKDVDSNLLAQFNRNGTFFYDTANRVVAKFARDEAYIGNILLTKNTVQSRDFASGALGKGFRIQDSGYAEFQDVFIRGKLSSVVFEKSTVSALNGMFLITKADVLDVDMTSLDSSTLTISGDTTFEINEILRIKDGFQDEWMRVTAVSSNSYTVARDLSSYFAADANPAWKKGITVVSIGVTGSGFIMLDASSAVSPVIQIYKRNSTTYNDYTEYVRLGNLNGFLGYTNDSIGAAIGTTNSYLKYDPVNGLRIKGSITVTGGDASKTYYQAEEPGVPPDTNTPKEGDYWIDTNDDNALYVYSSSAWQSISSAGGITTFRQSAVPTALNAGDLWIDTDDNKLYRATNEGDDQIIAGEWELQNAAIATGWSHTSDTTKIDGGDIYTGTVTADKITTTTLSAIVADLGTVTAGTLTGTTIQTALAGSRVLLNTSDLIAYDGFNDTALDVILTGADTGDVLIGNYTSGSGMKWDRSAFTFNVKGGITASSGSFTGTVNVGSAGRVYIDGANEVIKVYDASNNLRVEIGLLA